MICTYMLNVDIIFDTELTQATKIILPMFNKGLFIQYSQYHDLAVQKAATSTIHWPGHCNSIQAVVEVIPLLSLNFS